MGRAFLLKAEPHMAGQKQGAASPVHSIRCLLKGSYYITDCLRLCRQGTISLTNEQGRGTLLSWTPRWAGVLGSTHR